MKTAPLAALCFTALLGLLPVAASAQPYVVSLMAAKSPTKKRA